MSDMSTSPVVVAGRYAIEERVGRGGFADVYRARHLVTGQQVALKIQRQVELSARGEVDLSSARAAIRRERFIREAQVTAQLRHPCTVRVYDAGEMSDGRLFIAMEFVEGETLAEWLDGGAAAQGEAITEEFIVGVAADVLGALEEAHEAGHVHRDIKPSNIMLTSADGRRAARLLDFGVAAVPSSDLTSEEATIGTPVYMSPEQCTGAEVDGRSDLYGLGAVLFRCVCGRPPFPGPSRDGAMWGHVNKMVPRVADHARISVSSTTCDAIERALSKDPAERFESAPQMRHALLEGTVSGEVATQTQRVATLRTPSDPARAPGESLRSRRLVTAAVVLLLVGIAGVALLWLRTTADGPRNTQTAVGVGLGAAAATPHNPQPHAARVVMAAPGSRPGDSRNDAATRVPEQPQSRPHATSMNQPEKARAVVLGAAATRIVPPKAHRPAKSPPPRARRKRSAPRRRPTGGAAAIDPLRYDEPDPRIPE